MQQHSVSRILAPAILVLGVILAGCTGIPPVPGTGSVQLSSSPAGAEIYLDHAYQGTTPSTLPAVPAGNHTVEIRKGGYESWSSPVTIIGGSAVTLSATLASVPTTPTVIFATPTGSGTPALLPRIHVDGYWTCPSGSGCSTTNPASLLVHTDSFNVGYADAREVTVSANLYYQGRQICWNTVYLGTLKTGSHVTKDTMVSCLLPSGFTTGDLTIRFENIIVTP